MNTEEILSAVEKSTAEAQMREDLCARSTLVGLRSQFGFIPEEMITAAMSLAGGAGASSGSCGAYCAGLLAIGLKCNPTREQERNDLSLRQRGKQKFLEFRDAFLREFGTTLCPEIHRQLFGRSFLFTDPVQEAEFFALPDHAARCATVVGRAARIAAAIILAEPAAQPEASFTAENAEENHSKQS
jgi:hypothetical protein